MTATGDVYEEWQMYLNEQKKAEYAKLFAEEQLKSDKAVEFIEMAFTHSHVSEGGLEFNFCLQLTHSNQMQTAKAK